MLRWLTDLVTEHGSAAILRERVAQLRDQLTTAEKQTKDSETARLQLVSQIKELEAQKAALEQKVRDLQAEAEQLRTELKAAKPLGGFTPTRLPPERRMI